MDLGTTLLASAVVAAFVSALISGLISLRTTERSIKVEHVTRERTKWRDKVRDRAAAVHHAATTEGLDRLAALQLEFRLILNPFDPEDRKIIDMIILLAEPQGRDAKLAEFGDRVSLLLKHDWERASILVLGPLAAASAV